MYGNARCPKWISRISLPIRHIIATAIWWEGSFPNTPLESPRRVSWRHFLGRVSEHGLWLPHSSPHNLWECKILLKEQWCTNAPHFVNPCSLCNVVMVAILSSSLMIDHKQIEMVFFAIHFFLFPTEKKKLKQTGWYCSVLDRAISLLYLSLLSPWEKEIVNLSKCFSLDGLTDADKHPPYMPWDLGLEACNW